MNESHDPSHHSSDSLESTATYTLETVERITHISKDRIVLYSRYGLVSPVKAEGETALFFDDDAIHKLRRIAFLLSEYGINHDGLRVFASLLNEVERLRTEVRFLRQR